MYDATTPAQAPDRRSPLRLTAWAGLIALLLAFVLAVHDRGGTTYDQCQITDDPRTCTVTEDPR